MNITPDQARELLANQSERGALWNADWNFTDRTAAIVREDSPGDEVMEIRFNGDDTAFSDGDLTLAAAAPDLAQTVAGMTWQHAVEVYNADAKCWIRSSEWISHREVAERDIDAYSRAYGGAPTRLVRRLVGPVEEAK